MPRGGRFAGRDRRQCRCIRDRHRQSGHNWSAGVGATIDHKYLVNLSYIAYYGKHDTDANGEASDFDGPFDGLGTFAALFDGGSV
jgi:hypothetical protein